MDQDAVCFPYKVNQFHFCKNLCVDCMHDLVEGILKYDLGNVLHHFSIDQKMFSIHILNDRIAGLNYAKHDKRNRPPQISLDHSKNKKSSMSSSKMLHIFYTDTTAPDDCGSSDRRGPAFGASYTQIT